MFTPGKESRPEPLDERTIYEKSCIVNRRKISNRHLSLKRTMNQDFVTQTLRVYTTLIS